MLLPLRKPKLGRAKLSTGPRVGHSWSKGKRAPAVLLPHEAK